MFDTALIESAAPHAGVHSRAAKSLPLAIAFHAAVIAALVFSALVSTADPPEPVIPIAFPSFRGDPPPPPEGGPRPIHAVLPPRPRQTDATPVQMPQNPVVPVVENPSVELGSVDEAGSDGTSTGFGEPGGAKDGVEGGMLGETGRTDGDGNGPDHGDEAILRPGVGGVTAPELIERVGPLYPETARKLRQEGTVVLEAVITSAGTVDEVRVVASAGPLLDAAALSAVRSWRYRPATLNGRAVAVFLAVRVRFAIND
jgi:periplasmic protein TonB